jgi:Leucine-rich repeat (LRR) protein
LKLDCLTNLKHLDCGANEISNLDISNLVNLEILECGGNNLTSVDFLKKIPNPEKLKKLNIVVNNFSKQDLSCFGHLINLKELEIRNNSFVGSLEFLKHLTKLEILDIVNTDVDNGLEYLPDSLQEFYCWQNSDKQVKTIDQELKRYGKPKGD